VQTTLADAQAWYDLEGSSRPIMAAADSGVSPDELAARLEKTLPPTLRSRRASSRRGRQARPSAGRPRGCAHTGVLAFAGGGHHRGRLHHLQTPSRSLWRNGCASSHACARWGPPGGRCSDGPRRGPRHGRQSRRWPVSLRSWEWRGASNAPVQGGRRRRATAGATLAPRTIAVRSRGRQSSWPVWRPWRRPAGDARAACRRPAGGRRAAAVPFVGRFSSVVAAAIAVAASARPHRACSPAIPRPWRLLFLGLGVVGIFVAACDDVEVNRRPVAGVIGWPLEKGARVSGRLARENSGAHPARTAGHRRRPDDRPRVVVFVAVLRARPQGLVRR